MTVRGLDARLQWGYYAAGTLGAWSVTTAEDGRVTLTATVVSTDAFRVSQRPLVFVAPHARGVWSWPILELQVSGATLSARLGPKKAT